MLRREGEDSRAQRRKTNRPSRSITRCCPVVKKLRDWRRHSVLSVIWLTIMSETRSNSIIEKKVLIQASPDLIFQALTEAKDLAQWFCDRVTSDPRVGGEMKAYWRVGDGGEAQRGRAVFTGFTRDSMVELLWLDEGEGETRDAARHTICYTIRFRRGTSEVSMRDEGPPLADQEIFELLDQGWISVLRNLKEHCEAKQRSARRRSAAESGAEQPA